MSRRPGASSDSAATSGRKLNGRRTACCSMSQPGRSGAPEQAPGPERLELGPLGAEDVVQDPALGGQRSLHGPRGQLGRRDTGPQQGAGDGPGGRPDDDVGPAGVPAAVVLEHRQHAGVVGLTDHPAGAQDEPDTAHVPPSCARDHAWEGPPGRRPSPAPAEGGSTQASRAGGGGHRPGMPGCGCSAAQRSALPSS